MPEQTGWWVIFCHDLMELDDDLFSFLQYRSRMTATSKNIELIVKQWTTFDLKTIQVQCNLYTKETVDLWELPLSLLTFAFCLIIDRLLLAERSLFFLSEVHILSSILSTCRLRQWLEPPIDWCSNNYFSIGVMEFEIDWDFKICETMF